MSDFATVQVEGARELASLLRKIGNKDLQKALRQSHLSAASVVAARAKAKAPTKTGALQRSIRPGASLRSAYVRAGGTKRVPYAAAIHWGRKWGNVGSPPGNYKGNNPIIGRKFLWDAGNESIGAAAAIYERQVGHVFDQLRGMTHGA